LLAAGIISILGAGLFFMATRKAEAHTIELRSQISSQETQLAALKPTVDTLVELNATAKNLHILFDNQKKWDAILGTVEQRFYKNMVVSTLNFTDTGEVTLSAVTPTYTDYAKVYQSLTDADGAKYFSTVRPGNITKSENKEKGTSEIQFSFAMILQKNITHLQVVTFLADLTSPKLP
jgi:Tfp pilus assembly protein PilN